MCGPGSDPDCALHLRSMVLVNLAPASSRAVSSAAPAAQDDPALSALGNYTSLLWLFNLDRCVGVRCAAIVAEDSWLVADQVWFGCATCGSWQLHQPALDLQPQHMWLDAWLTARSVCSTGIVACVSLLLQQRTLSS